MLFDYVPELKNDDEKLVFEGHLSVDVPDEFERIEIAKGMNFKDGETKETKDVLDTALKMKKLAHERIKEVHIKYNGVAIDSVEALSFSQEGSALINEVGQMCIGGIKLGNILPPQ